MRGRQASLGRGAKSNSARSWSCSRNSSRPFMSLVMDTGSAWLTLSIIGADQDQAAGAALAVGGGDAPMR